MSNASDKMPDRYIYLHIEPEGMHSGFFQCQSSKHCEHTHTPSRITISVKLDDEGVVVDAYALGGSGAEANEEELIDSTWKTYDEMGVEARELLTIEKQQIAKEIEDEQR